MGGIAGFVQRERVAEEGLLRDMCGRIAHRGPGAEGVFADGPCALGCRTIEMQAGQPAPNEDRSVWAVVDGFICNGESVRRDLEGRGHKIQSDSAAELIAHQYEEDGPAAGARLRGSFAFAVWDRNKQRLTLSRDRAGEKPLYLAEAPDGVYFGSEIRALRAAEIPFDLDEEALRLYLLFGYVPHPRSSYKGIRKIAPGGWLTYDANGRIQQQRYWRLPVPHSRTPKITEDDAAVELGRLVDEAVRLRAGLNAGVLLSAGLDSAAVLASMAAQAGGPVRTFSIAFEDAGESTLESAEFLASHFGSVHEGVLIRPHATELVESIAARMDEPLADPAVLPAFLAAEIAKRSAPLALSGAGADEFFADGWSVEHVRDRRWLSALPGPFRAALAISARALPPGASQPILRAAGKEHAFERFVHGDVASAGLYESLIRPAWRAPVDMEYLRRALEGCLLPDSARNSAQAFYFDATSRLPESKLVRSDRMSMAVSFEVRPPFLDHVLVEFAASLPLNWNVRGGRGKAMLARAFKDRLPADALADQGAGFTVPLRDWFRGPLLSMAHDRLSGRRLRDSGIVAPAAARHLVSEHASGTRDHEKWLWRLLVLDLWLEANKG